jgi:glycosyltransferase involved in cell wall biosynthesis
MTKTMFKVAFFHNECAPYRIPLFQKMSELSNIKLMLFFGRRSSSYRKWEVPVSFSFRYQILWEIEVLRHLFGQDNSVNPTLFFKLVSNRYDVYIGGEAFYFSTILTFFVAKALRKPFILALEDVDQPVKSNESRFDLFSRLPFKEKPAMLVSFVLMNTFSRFIIKHSDAYVVPGKATRNFLLRRGVNPSKIQIAANATDNEAIEQQCEESLKEGRVEKLKAKSGLRNKKIILTVAYLSERKGIQYLIPAYARLKREMKDIVLVVVGEGQYENVLKRLSAQNDVETIFAGYVSNLIDYYLAADVFVLPTLDDVWGFVINEAMVCGCPVITTRNAGASLDLVRDGVNGFVVEPGSISQLYRALKEILKSPSNAKLMGEKSREIIRDYCYEKSVKGYESAIAYVTSLKGDVNVQGH